MPQIGSTSGAAATYPGIPRSGAQGQLLAKNSSAAADAAWGTTGGNFANPLYISNSWYGNSIDAYLSQVGQTILTAKYTYYVPLWLPFAVPITAIAAPIANGAGSSATITMGAMTASLATGKPSALIGSGVTTVATGNSTTTAVSAAVSLTLPAGWSFLALNCSLTNVQTYGSGLNEVPNFLGVADPSTSDLQFGWYSTSTTAFSVSSLFGLYSNPMNFYFQVA